MNYSKFIQVNKQDLKKINEFESVNFFRHDLVHYWIWILVLETNYSNIFYNLEDIIQIIPSKLSSRVSIFRIVDNAVKKKYLIKEKNNLDKRKFNIIPTQQTIKEFEGWVKIYKGLD